ncbi:hypothetical protein L2Z53_11845 (plasmid) [Macrococcoides canis]|uniref:hypothetical protein n=1 Tax=Macrococcoides canis TaxID=1855823 RepID=UPI001F352277|nr:hypothetical protein [Macrococcus canis]UJS29027.1 hypothetical protein L2Z53_11845 [Macrococcus canis]
MKYFKNEVILFTSFIVLIMALSFMLVMLIINYMPGSIAMVILGICFIYFILSKNEKHIRLKNELSLLSPIFITIFLFILSMGILFKMLDKDFISDYLVVILMLITLIIAVIICCSICRYFYRTKGNEKMKVLIYKTIYQVIAYGLTIYTLIQQISASLPDSSEVFYLIYKYILLLSSYSALISINFFESYYKIKE